MGDRILKGPPLKAPRIDKGIGEFFFEQAQKYRDNIFQINGDTGETETYDVVKRKSTKVAIQLRKIGIRPKDIVMICCRNNTDNIIPVLATLYVGAYVSSLEPRQTVPDVKRAIGLINPKLMIVEEDSIPLIEKSLEDTNFNPEIIVIGNSDKYGRMYDVEVESEEEETFVPRKQRGSDKAIIIFSSGTTSEPKGIYLSNSYILNGAQSSLQHMDKKPEVLLHFLSFYWITTWFITGLCLVSGARKVVSPVIMAERFLLFVDKYKITHVMISSTFTYGISAVPQDLFKKYDTSSLHNFCVIGSTVAPAQILRLRKLFPYSCVSLGYGSSEANVLVGHELTNRRGYENKLGSSGTLCAELQLKIVDLDSGALLGPNKEGEICVKSPFLFLGYHKFEKPDTFDEDGFLKMGDVGYYDEDKYIYITDRIGEMFKYRINHISPSLVEHILLSHPAVAEAVVFGVPHEIDKNHPGASVVLRKGANATIQELLEFTNPKVTNAYQLRAGLTIVEALAKTPTGKVQRRIARNLFIETKKEELNKNGTQPKNLIVVSKEDPPQQRGGCFTVFCCCK